MSSSFGQLWRWGALALLTGGLAATGLTGCNTHPVDYTTSSGNFGVSVDFSPQTAESVDILWVIDNSGSMCQEQKAIAENFDSFIKEFGNQNIDFQMGVTTTHQTPEGVPPSLFDNIQYGELQNRPLPRPSSVPGCSSPDAVTTSLVRAAACTTNPESQKTSLTSGEEACLEDASSAACQTYCTSNASEAWCEDAGGSFTFDKAAFYDAIFPAANEYRDFPKVLRRDDYVDGSGNVDIEALRADFACISFVGVSGWGIEKGLGAARKAVSPDMVGTYYDPEQEPPEDAPNYGLIRQDSQFALITVTDENDCTYDNNRTESINAELVINERDAGGCFNDICEFANSTQYSEEESPLIPPETLAGDIAASIQEIKQQEVGIEDLIVASIHGEERRYDGAAFTKEECGQEGYEEIGPPCDTQAFGTAFSGDRYQRFVELFPDDQRFPTKDQYSGQMCLPEDIAKTLGQISEIIRAKTQVCMDEEVYRCETPDDCPAYPLTGEPSACSPFASTGDNYCESAIQLVMWLDENEASEDQLANPAQALEDSGYCKEGTVDTPEMPGRCIVSRDRYELNNCPDNDNGLTVSWNSATYFSEIGEFNVEINYAVTPGGIENDTPQQ
jgi:hypothetical protein